MNATTQHSLDLSDEELLLLRDLLENAHTRLMIEIRHTDHRSFREDLRLRLTLLEGLLARCRT